jgi:heme exporter protein A
MLEAQDLAARRGYSQLFTGLSFRVAAGEALVITGANGTGKTTLLRMLAGLSAPTEGVIRWEGRPVAPFDPGLRHALDAVALGQRRSLPARVLSQGQRRRIGLARLSLLHRPLWILDEPVTALDAAGIALLAKLVADHLEDGGLAVAATHAPLGLPEERVRALALE